MPREEISEKLPEELNRPSSHQHLIASCFHNVWLPGTYVYTDWAGKPRAFRRIALYLLEPASLLSHGCPSPGALTSLGDPRTWTILQSTPSLLLPLTEMLQGLCSSPLFAAQCPRPLGSLHVWEFPSVCTSIFFLTNSPGSGVRPYSDTPVTPNITDPINNCCVLKYVAAVTQFSSFITPVFPWSVACYRGVWVWAFEFYCLCSKTDSPTFCLCNPEQPVFPFCKMSMKVIITAVSVSPDHRRSRWIECHWARL